MSYSYVRFRSSLFAANLSALHTSFAWYRNDWLGIEGSAHAGFGSSTFNNGQPSQLALLTVGPRIAWRTTKWQPWAHALVGTMHIFPQTALGLKGFAVQTGGGVDWRLWRLASIRFECDYLRSQLHSSGQNSFLFGTGLVLHM